MVLVTLSILCGLLACIVIILLTWLLLKNANLINRCCVACAKLTRSNRIAILPRLPEIVVSSPESGSSNTNPAQEVPLPEMQTIEAQMITYCRRMEDRFSHVQGPMPSGRYVKSRQSQFSTPPATNRSNNSSVQTVSERVTQVHTRPNSRCVLNSTTSNVTMSTVVSEVSD